MYIVRCIEHLPSARVGQVSKPAEPTRVSLSFFIECHKQVLKFYSRVTYYCTCRMIRQDSELWNDLHQGILTTGKLNSCLGFYEPKAAKRLGIGRHFVNHYSLLSVWRHLQEKPYLPRVSNIRNPVSDGSYKKHLSCL